jgi:hypothetical protein
MAWDVLDPQERAEILALFPDKKHVLDASSDDARPNVPSLMNDDTFRHDCASYTENVSLGRFDPQWLAEAWAAQEARKMGDFDEYLVNKFEETWSVKLPEDLRPKRSAMNGPSKDSKDSKDSMSIEQDKAGLQQQTGHEEEDHSAFSSIQGRMAPIDGERLFHTPGKCKGERLDAEDKMAIDELQVETKEEVVQPSFTGRRSYSTRKMDLDCSGSEDELA